MFSRDEFLDFMRRVDEAEFWNEFEVTEWILACEYAGIEYFAYDCPDGIYTELDRVRKEIETI